MKRFMWNFGLWTDTLRLNCVKPPDCNTVTSVGASGFCVKRRLVAASGMLQMVGVHYVINECVLINLSPRASPYRETLAGKARDCAIAFWWVYFSVENDIQISGYCKGITDVSHQVQIAPIVTPRVQFHFAPKRFELLI